MADASTASTDLQPGSANGRSGGHRWMALVASLNKACSQFYSGAKDSGPMDWTIGPPLDHHFDGW